MQNLKNQMENFKELFVPVFKQALNNKFNDTMQSAIAYGFGYKETIEEQKIYDVEEEIETQNENGEIEKKLAKVTKVEMIEVDNPVSKIEFIAEKYFEILAEKSLENIQKYFAEVVAKTQISEAINGLIKE